MSTDTKIQNATDSPPSLTSQEGHVSGDAEHGLSFTQVAEFAGRVAEAAEVVPVGASSAESSSIPLSMGHLGMVALKNS